MVKAGVCKTPIHGFESHRRLFLRCCPRFGAYGGGESAEVAELADARDLKSLGLKVHAGSSPALGTFSDSILSPPGFEGKRWGRYNPLPYRSNRKVTISLMVKSRDRIKDRMASSPMLTMACTDNAPRSRQRSTKDLISTDPIPERWYSGSTPMSSMMAWKRSL